MTNELRARDGMLAGTLDIDHTSGATTLTAAILAAHRAIDSTMHSAWIITDPHQGLLARTAYTGGSDTHYTLSVGSSFADVDATNLAVTFVAPRSGKVVVRLIGALYVPPGSDETLYNLRDGSGDVAGTSTIAGYVDTTASIESVPAVSIPVTGLTPGTAYTWKWGAKRATGSASQIYHGPTFGQLQMEVWDGATSDSPANSEIVYVTAHTAAAGTATITRGQEGTTAQAWKAGSRIVHGPTLRDLALGRVAFATRTAGNLSTASTSWGDLTTALDLTVAAQAGDIIEYGINGQWDSAATQGTLDVATIVSGSPVNFFFSANNNANNGIFGWEGLSGVNTPFGGSVFYQVQAGDVAAGKVTLRLRAAAGAALTKTLFATVASPLHVWAKNLGPQEA